MIRVATAADDQEVTINPRISSRVCRALLCKQVVLTGRGNTTSARGNPRNRGCYSTI
jgi:hypothetical protein